MNRLIKSWCFFVFSLFVVSACTDRHGKGNQIGYADNGDCYVIDIAAMESVENYQELIREIAFISLETNEHSLLSHIDKVVFHKGKFYIHDRRFAALKVFSEEGKYIRSIGYIGRGPGEFPTLMDFMLDPEDELNLPTVDTSEMI